MTNINREIETLKMNLKGMLEIKEKCYDEIEECPFRDSSVVAKEQGKNQ